MVSQIGQPSVTLEIPMRNAFFVFALMLVPLVVGAQTAPDSIPQVAAPGKSVALARVIGIIPGAGHVYAGQWTRGLGFVGGIFGVATLTAILLVGDCVADVLSSSVDCKSTAIENLGGAAVYGVWAWSIYDAGVTARRTNARRSGPALNLALSRRPTASGHDARALNLGLTFKVR